MQGFGWAVLIIIVAAIIVALLRFLVYRYFRKSQSYDQSGTENPDRNPEEYYSNKYIGGFNGLSNKKF